MGAAASGGGGRTCDSTSGAASGATAPRHDHGVRTLTVLLLLALLPAAHACLNDSASVENEHQFRDGYRVVPRATMGPGMTLIASAGALVLSGVALWAALRRWR